MLSFGKDTLKRAELSDPDPVHHENDPAGQGFAVSKLGLQLTAEPPVNYNRP
jgi:hypothetical protein